MELAVPPPKRRSVLAYPATGRSIPLISPAEGVSEEMIRQLVETFYDRVIRDPSSGRSSTRSCPAAGACT